jgi:hypothetical protein
MSENTLLSTLAAESKKTKGFVWFDIQKVLDQRAIVLCSRLRIPENGGNSSVRSRRNADSLTLRNLRNILALVGLMHCREWLRIVLEQGEESPILGIDLIASIGRGCHVPTRRFRKLGLDILHGENGIDDSRALVKLLEDEGFADSSALIVLCQSCLSYLIDQKTLLDSFPVTP